MRLLAVVEPSPVRLRLACPRQRLLRIMAWRSAQAALGFQQGLGDLALGLDDLGRQELASTSSRNIAVRSRSDRTRKPVLQAGRRRPPDHWRASAGKPCGLLSGWRSFRGPAHVGRPSAWSCAGLMWAATFSAHVVICASTASRALARLLGCLSSLSACVAISRFLVRLPSGLRLLVGVDRLDRPRALPTWRASRSPHLCSAIQCVVSGWPSVSSPGQIEARDAQGVEFCVVHCRAPFLTNPPGTKSRLGDGDEIAAGDVQIVAATRAAAALRGAQFEARRRDRAPRGAAHPRPRSRCRVRTPALASTSSRSPAPATRPMRRPRVSRRTRRQRPSSACALTTQSVRSVWRAGDDRAGADHRAFLRKRLCHGPGA